MNTHKSESQIQASIYNGMGLNVLPIHEVNKTPSLNTYSWWQYDFQEQDDISRLMHKPAIDIAVLGGVPSGNAFYVDCESKECFAEFVTTTVKYVVKSPVCVSSEWGGHIWFRAPYPVKSHTFGDFEIKGQGNYVLAPPSRHSLGSCYEFTNDSRNIPIIAGLPFVTLEPRFVPRVSTFAHNLFRGREEREYESKSHRDQAFILSLVRSGFDEEMIGKSLSIVQFASKYKYLLKTDPRAARQYLTFSFKRALSFPESEQFVQNRVLTSQWEDWALRDKWTGRTGAVDRAVFLAHLYCSNLAGSSIYYASVRQLAELAQTAPITVSKANKRLTDLGVLHVHQKHCKFEAFEYRLESQPPRPDIKHVHAGCSEGTTLSMYVCTSLIGDPFCAIWEHKGMGKTAQIIWESLAEPKTDHKAICEATARSIPTVQRLMKKLIQYGLAVKDVDGYTQAKNVNWIEIMKLLGTQDRQAARMIRHQQDRAAQRARFTKKKARQ